MDKKTLAAFVGIGLAAVAVYNSQGAEDGGGNGDGGNGETETVTIKLTVQGGGQARFVLDGDPQEWTESSTTLEVDPGTQVEIDTEANRGYEFSRFEGTKPPYTA